MAKPERTAQIRRDADRRHSRVRQILERIHEVISETGPEVQSYIKTHPEFAGIGEQMLEEWEDGSATALRN